MIFTPHLISCFFTVFGIRRHHHAISLGCVLHHVNPVPVSCFVALPPAVLHLFPVPVVVLIILFLVLSRTFRPLPLDNRRHGFWINVVFVIWKMTITFTSCLLEILSFVCLNRIAHYIIQTNIVQYQRNTITI